MCAQGNVPLGHKHRMQYKYNSKCRASFWTGAWLQLSSSVIADDWFGGRVDHGGVVDWREEPVTQVKLVLPQQDGPDRLDLHVRKTLANAAVPTWREREEGRNQHSLPHELEGLKVTVVQLTLTHWLVELTGTKGDVGKLVAVGSVALEKAVGDEGFGLAPGLSQPLVDSGGDARLVAGGNGVVPHLLREQVERRE